MGKNLLRRFDGDILCPKLELCSQPILISDDFNKFRNDILLDKPPRTYTDSSIPCKLTSEMKFAVVTDLHVDMAYSTVTKLITYRIRVLIVSHLFVAGVIHLMLEMREIDQVNGGI
jgi:hypothetical protein